MREVDDSDRGSEEEGATQKRAMEKEKSQSQIKAQADPG